MRGINRKILTAALAVALAGSFAVGAVHSAPATAAGADATYLVLAPQGHSTAKATARVAAAGGTVVAAYPQIGVLVARSTNPGFATAASGAGVEAVASTTGLGTPLEEDESLQVIGSTAQEATGNPTGEPLWSQQWDMTQIDVAEAHAVTTGSPNVVVGVLDSGISQHAPGPGDADREGQERLLPRRGRQHGRGGLESRPPPATARMSRERSPAAINGVGIAGVAPGVKVASVKVVTDAGFIYPEAAVCGFVWAADHGMQITNNSYFIDPWEFNCRNDARQRPVWQAVQRATPVLAVEGRAQHRLGRELERRPAAQVHRLREPERRQLAARDPRDQRRLRRSARGGARRRHRLGGRHRAAEELLLLLRPGRRRRHRARR